MKYDIVVIGSGSGLMVLEEAAKQGLKCAIVEKGKFGGTCLTKGCIPSKMLVYPADLIREIEVSGRVGVRAGKPEIDWKTISKRMWEQIGYTSLIEEELDDLENVTVYRGSASFTGPNSLVVRYADGKQEDVIEGEKFVIAAGARSFVPNLAGLEEAGYVTSETFFGDKFPHEKPWDSLAIIGSGSIATEFAHIFSAFGTKVTMIARSGSILTKEEPEIASFVASQLEKVGVDILTNADILSVEKQGERKVLTVEDRQSKQQHKVECEEIFVASGMRSNGDSLDLEKAGVKTDKNGWIITNGYLETSQKHIWAIGDINGKYQFRHKANHEAQVLAKNLFGGERREASYEAVPWAIFTHPQVARVGKTEKQLQESGIPYRVAVNHYSEVVGGISMGFEDEGDDNGFVKVIVGEDRKILGVHIVGPQAAILVQPFVYLMNAGYQCQKKMQDAKDSAEIEGLRLICPRVGTYTPINDSMVIHPSLNELTAWVFEDFDL